MQNLSNRIGIGNKPAGSKLLTVLLSLDISAAFDTLGHNHLLHANDLFAFDGMVLDWLRPYHLEQEQFVAVGGSRSSAVILSTGVPQGLILEPLPFVVFTSPVRCLTSSFTISYHQFADDTLFALSSSRSPHRVSRSYPHVMTR